MVDVQSSATAPSFDAASAEAMAATLRMIIDKHGTGLLANHRKLFGLLRDYAPSEPRAIRVLMSAFDLGIAERLAGTQAMSPDALNGEARSLAADTGLRDDLARWAVDVWAKARTPLASASSGFDTPPAPPPAADVEAHPAGGSDLTWGSIPTPPPQPPTAVGTEAAIAAPAAPEPLPLSAAPPTGVVPPSVAPVPASAPAPATLQEPASMTWGSEPHPAAPPPPVPTAPPVAVEPLPVVAVTPPAIPAPPPAVPPAAASLTWGSEPLAAAAAPPPAPSVPPQPPLAIAPSVPPIAPNAPTVPPAPASLTWGSDPQTPAGPPPMAPSAAPATPPTAANVAWYLNPKVGASFAVICSIIYFGANYIGKHPLDAPVPTPPAAPARPTSDPVVPPKPAPVAPVAPVAPDDPGPAVVGSTSTNPADWPEIAGTRIDGDKSTWKYEMNIKMPDGHFYIYEVSVKMTGMDVGIGVVRAVEWTKRAADVSFISVATHPIITRFFSNSSKSFHTSVSTQIWDRNPTNAPPLCFAFNSGTTKQRFQPEGGYVCASPMNGADCVDVPIGCGHFK